MAANTLAPFALQWGWQHFVTRVGEELITASHTGPDESAVIAMAAEVLTDGGISVARFPIGAGHFVYEAVATNGDRVVVRISRRRDAAVTRDTRYWSEKLRPLGVPLPEVLHADATMQRHPFPFTILERLPGRDLGSVVDRMAPDAQHSLAVRLVSIQAIVADLPLGQGYGFVSRLEGPFPFADWGQVVIASIERSRRRIRTAGVFGDQHADLVEAASGRLTSYFATVPPTPFLHDITTRNVIIEDSRLSGIVDVDDLCFGDPLFLVGLIRMALLADGQSLHYADSWTELLSPGASQHAALNFYTAFFCLDFMGEVGQRFNREIAAPTDQVSVKRLEALLEHILAPGPVGPHQ